MNRKEFKEKIRYRRPEPGVVEMIMPSGFVIRNLVFSERMLEEATKRKEDE